MEKSDIYFGRYTCQPYLVMGCENFYQNTYMKDGISHFYSFNLLDNEEEIKIIPSGSLDLIFEYSENSDMKMFFLSTLEKIQMLHLQKDKEYFCVRFKSGFIPTFLEISGKEIANLGLADFENIDFDSMKNKADFKERVQEFLLCYYKIYKKKAVDFSKYSIVKECKNLIYNSKGGVKISELERKTGYTARYLNKLFELEVGVSPKEFCKIIRFQNLLQDFNQGKYSNLSELASEFGYCDQSQMNKELKSYVNLTAKQYEKKVVKKGYFEKIISVPISTRNFPDLVI